MKVNELELNHYYIYRNDYIIYTLKRDSRGVVGTRIIDVNGTNVFGNNFTAHTERFRPMNNDHIIDKYKNSFYKLVKHIEERGY